jgi:predicted amidohydrolase YtcJ
MCRGCFSQFHLHDGLFEAGSRALFTNSALAEMQNGSMPLSAAAASSAGTLSASRSTFAADSGADTIFVDGTIIPMPGMAQVQALAIGNGKVLAAGTQASVMGLKTKNTQIVDLAGRTLLPGLIDPHNHTVLSAIILELLADASYEKYPTRPQFIDGLRAIAARTPPGQWIAAANFDNLLQGGDLSREELDGVSTQHPIFVWYTNGHDACVNSMALEQAKIPDDVGVLPGGGHFGRGPDGKLNGLVYEEPAILKFISLALPKITPQIAAKAARDYLRTVAAAGNTFVHEPGTVRSEWLEPYAKLSNGLACRVSCSIMYEDMKGLIPYKNLGLGPKAAQLPNSMLTIYGIKIVGDGSDQTETGAMTAPYLNSTNKGTPNFDAAQMKQMVADVKNFGMSVQIHCNGDYTLDIALDAIEAAYGNSTAFGINRIEHSTMARADQVQRMKKLNVQPSFLMNHVRLYGAAYRDHIFGPPRAMNADPAGWCMKENVPFTLHTDSPCSPIGPLNLIETAVTRRCIIDNSVIGEDQAISVDQALRAVTIDAARQCGMGDRIGSLEEGKEADITILESNPYTVDPDTISKIKVSETWVAGQKKFG